MRASVGGDSRLAEQGDGTFAASAEHLASASRSRSLAPSASASRGPRRRMVSRLGEMVERSFAHVLDRGGMRRAWLRGRENLHERYLVHVAGFNLAILMLVLIVRRPPR